MPNNQPLNIYLVNVDFPPVSGPGIWRILAFAKYAALAGHRVTVFCSDRSSWHDRHDPNLLTELPESVRVVRISSYFLRDITGWITRRRKQARNKFVQNLYKNLLWKVQRYWPDPIAHWAIKCALSALRMAKSDKPDCIFTTGPQHLSHVVGYALLRRLSIPWIMDYRDPWTDIPDHSYVDVSGYQNKLAMRLEQRFLENADLVTVVSPSWLDMLAKKLTYRREKLVLLRNGHDLEPTFTPVGLNKSNFVGCLIHFNGTIQPGASILTELFQALESLVKLGLTPDSLQISFCGLPPSFVNLLQESSVRDFYVDLGVLRHEESIQQCLTANALMVTVRDQGAVQQGVIPGKTYEAMALGTHVFGILPSKSDTRTLLEEYGNITLTDGTSPSDIATALQRLIEKFKVGNGTLPRCEEAHRKFTANRYARTFQANELMEQMHRLVSGKRSQPCSD